MAYAALISLSQTTDLILNPQKYFISADVKEEITSIRERAIYLMSFLENFPEKANRLEGKMRDVANKAEDVIEDFMCKKFQFERVAKEEIFGSIAAAILSSTLESTVTKIRDVANKTEDVIEDFMCKQIDQFEKQLKRVKEEIGSIAEDTMDDRLGDSPAAAISSSSRLASTGKNDMVIGLDEELIVIKERLRGESSKLEVIPIFGMGGIGKTTLARYAYDDQLSVEHFNIRSWVTISQAYSAQNILSCLRDSMKSSDKEVLALENEATMREKVYKCLKGRRYLIVLDDVWTTKVLDDVRRIFPDDDNGSRIMLTTRLSDVANHAISSSPVYEMKFMEEDQCWNLLKQKVFTNGNCQDCASEVEDIGKNIARSCRGLPLAVVLVAGILCKEVVTLDSWKNIEKDVHSVVGKPLEKILSLSYTHLPHHLRSCFLYMGCFPEDHEVRVSKLIKLWVAEGFLRCTNKSRSLEGEAEDYLEDLVERSLVLVTSRKSSGKIKSCSLHDLVRVLCIRKAREEKFLVHVADKCEDVHRLGITNSDNLKDICGLTFHTILCFQGSCLSSVECWDRGILLKILDVENDSDQNLPPRLFELYHLRYLALQNPIHIPPTIWTLENLQTLIINSKDQLTFGLFLWKMPQLRHLVVRYLYASRDPLADGSTIPLENLQTLSEVIGLKCSKKLLQIFTNVQKLRLIYDRKRDYQLYNLAHLYKLQNLKVTLRNFSWVGLIPAFPRTLKKLTLKGGGFPWKDMTIVGSLPNLEVLKLVNHACDGDIWETTDGEFPQLKFLLIERSSLRRWETDCGHFPSLKCLILRLCRLLRKIPDNIADNSSLEIIEVDYWNNFLVESAKEIKEDQHSNGNYTLQVRIVRIVDENRSLEETNGKICYMIGARKLKIFRSDDPQAWQWKACAVSRFSEVAQLIRVSPLVLRLSHLIKDSPQSIGVKIKTEMLSSNTTYAAYLVFNLAKGNQGFELNKAIVRFVGDAETREVVVHLRLPNGAQRQNGGYPVWRVDGWVEVELGTFFNEGVDDREVEAWLIKFPLIYGLIIEGIEFRPKKQVDPHEIRHTNRWW